MAEYVVEFWTLTADSKWNDKALQGIFLHGLSDQIKDGLAARDDLAGLNPLVSLVN